MEEELGNKKGRVIVRNLVFTLGKKQIQKLFQPFGEIVEINLPMNNANNENRGFAFVQFRTRKEAVKAISKLNGTTFKSRVIAVDLSVPKTVYKAHEGEAKKDDEEDIEEMKMDTEEVKVEQEKLLKKVKKDKVKADDSKEKIIPDKNSTTKKKANKFDEKTTLFVRNISFDTTEEEFKEYFSTYGEINYAKLCMNPETKMHKGTGFVQYKSEADAHSMVELSKQAESYYDQQKSKKGFNPKQSELLDELELNGRRLIVVPAVKREDVGKVKEESSERKKRMFDRRNTHLTREGLTNIEDFANSAVAESEVQRRQKYADAKGENLRKNPNYRVSLTRLRLRNLPKKDFKVEDLKDTFKNVLEEYIESKSKEEKAKLKKQKLIIQAKIMYEDGTSKAEGEKSRGLGYVEMADHDVALYCERALNNFPLKGRRLIIDFALEDQRKILKREKKKESFMKKTEVKKVEKPREKKETRKEEQSIAEINDAKKLKEMLRKCGSRGKKQRIKKKLIALGEMKAPEKVAVERKEAPEEEPVEKLAGKRKPGKNKQIENEILELRRQGKQKKRNEKRKSDSKFEELLKGYLDKISKSLGDE
eukprot:TRINITY_DN3963_c0_g2_i2.p1 TRINITY_DN3963_c0_g2~~TRINITY_DN3963_c0_g2_i2.p1  ORF type:complete len:592 (+),score=219.44 TRINITY_DN3963_c0_g2_i2:99-1874(+)